MEYPFWIYLKIVGETDISRMGYYFGTLGSGIKWVGFNLDGIIAHVGIAMIAMLHSPTRPGGNILLLSATWHGPGRKVRSWAFSLRNQNLHTHYLHIPLSPSF